jgi:hypothetical protein
MFVEVQGNPPVLDSTKAGGSDTNSIQARQGGTANGKTTLKVVRLLDISKQTPVDPWDKSITTGVNRISFAFGPSTNLFDYHGSNRGTADITVRNISSRLTNSLLFNKILLVHQYQHKRLSYPLFNNHSCFI